MYFSKAKSLTIPEGNVTQIADASGRVLWSAVQQVKVAVRALQANANASVIIDGVSYGGGFVDAMVSVPVGTVITCGVGCYNGTGYIYLDGTIVANTTSKPGTAYYDYTVLNDTTIYLAGNSDGGEIYIDSIVEPEGLVYLRPSADVSITGSLTLVPAEATAAYLLVNDVETDGNATRIMVSDSSSASGTATFKLAGTTPNHISRVTNLHLVISGASENITGKYCDAVVSVITAQATYVARANGSMNGYAPTETIIGQSENLLTELNNYLAKNGVLPDLDLSVHLSVNKSESDSGKDTMSFSVSQVYIALECE